MKKNVVRILTAVLMLSVVFSSSVFAAEKQQSAWDSFVGLFTGNAVTVADTQVDGVTYRTHIQNDGWAQGWVSDGDMSGSEGRGLRLEGIEIKIDGDTLPDGLGITYRTHIENDGWAQGWVEDGEMSGSYGRGLRLEAIEIKLTGDNADDYTVLYRTHIQNDGWAQGWVADGELSGSEGRGLRLEGIEIKIEQKTADLTEYEAALADVTQADYTAASWTAYQAVVNANVVDEDNLQSEVDEATAAITAAQANLVLVPKVTSVTAINANQVQVAFNTPIKASSIISNTTTGALVAGNFTIGRSPLAVAPYLNKNVSTFAFGFLSTDGKTLTLTATSPTYFDGTYTLTVADSVKTTSDVKVTPYAGTFTATDAVAPTVTALTYNTITGNIEATLSEPLAAVPSIVRVNGAPVAGSALVTPDGTKVTIPKPASATAGSTATVYIAGATDLALNQLVGYTGSVAITSDATALAVSSISQSSSNVIKVVFNKSIASIDSVVDGATTVLVDGVSTANTVAKDTTDTQNKTYLITVPGASAAPTYFYGTASTKNLVVVFQDAIITDVFGQKLATSTNTVAMTKDTLGPVATSVKLSDDSSKIEVTFDEPIAATGTLANIVLRKDGVALAAPTAAAQKAATGDDAKVLVITPAASSLSSGVFPAGTYTVRLNADAIKDVNTNANLATNLTLTVSGTTTENPIAAIANVNVTTNPNEYTVTYTEADGTTAAPVTAATALAASSYKLDGNTLPAGTDIYFDATLTTSKVHIVLPAGSINVGVVGTGTNASLTVAGVVTTAGKTVTTKTGVISIVDNTSAKISSVSVTGNIIFVKFNESVAGTPAASSLTDFNIQVDGAALNLGTQGETSGVAGTAVSTIVAGQTDTVQIVITPATQGTAPSTSYVASNWDTTKTIGVNYKGSSLTDANLFPIAAATTSYITNK